MIKPDAITSGSFDRDILGWNISEVIGSCLWNESVKNNNV